MPRMPSYRPTKIVPPVWFVLTLIAMFTLHRFAPIARVVPGPWHWFGLAPLVAGLALTAVAARLFTRLKTGLVPFTPVTTLVDSGPYRYTRNPMYLGMVLILAGVATLYGTLSTWLAVVAFAWWIDFRFIRHEEAMLEEQFGEEFAAFKQRVRRWI
jgi:protein-S-isoprenylcysteine O-methyltransferase Ste14